MPIVRPSSSTAFGTSSTSRRSPSRSTASRVGSPAPLADALDELEVIVDRRRLRPRRRGRRRRSRLAAGKPGPSSPTTTGCGGYQNENPRPRSSAPGSVSAAALASGTRSVSCRVPPPSPRTSTRHAPVCHHAFEDREHGGLARRRRVARDGGDLVAGTQVRARRDRIRRRPRRSPASGPAHPA